ncbi:hypothetical protein F1880_001919 [Penicillium rolfsii]|nr:hypothetical protein F1880_001919 [Penicillium rolfsii]
MIHFDVGLAGSLDWSLDWAAAAPVEGALSSHIFGAEQCGRPFPSQLGRFCRVNWANTRVSPRTNDNVD